jgi:hypothetical protein
MKYRTTNPNESVASAGHRAVMLLTFVSVVEIAIALRFVWLTVGVYHERFRSKTGA